MKRFLRISFALALATACVATVWGAGRDYYVHHKKPGSSMIELCEPIVATGSSVLAPYPTGKQIRLPANYAAVLKVTNAPTGGNPSLNLWFQHSADDGQTWQDFACVNTTTTGTYYIPISTVASGWSPVNLVTFETGFGSEFVEKTRHGCFPFFLADKDTISSRFQAGDRPLKFGLEPASHLARKRMAPFPGTSQPSPDYLSAQLSILPVRPFSRFSH